MKKKLTSRKLWLTILGGAVVAWVAPAALPAYISWAAPTYVAAEAAVDVARAVAEARKSR